MNECFTVLIFGNFSVERKRKVKEGVRKRKEERLRERQETRQVVQKRAEVRLRQRLVIQ